MPVRRYKTGDGRREFSHKRHKRHKNTKRRCPCSDKDTRYKGRRETGDEKSNRNRRDRPPCLPEDTRYKGRGETGAVSKIRIKKQMATPHLQTNRFAVPPSFRETIVQLAIAKVHQRKPSRTARKSVSQPTSILQPTLQAVSCRSATKAICAVLAPRRMRAAFFAYFFLLLKKSRSPKASKATNNALGPNALEKRATAVLMGADQHLVSFNFWNN